MREYLENIIKELVDKPDKIQVEEFSANSISVFEVRVDNSDRGKVIGKNGQHVRAIRTLLNAALARQKKRAILEIIE